MAMKTPEEVIERHRHLDAKAILGALQTAGYIIVPKEPTEQMMDAVYGHFGERSGTTSPLARSIYQDMIAASHDA